MSFFKVLGNVKELSLDQVDLKFHQYSLEEEEIQTEEFTAGAGDDGESVSAANYCVLPHISCEGLWESLIFDNNVKESVSSLLNWFHCQYFQVLI